MKRLLLTLAIILLVTTAISGLVWYLVKPPIDTPLPIILPVGYY
jgi:hypothetical protein